MIVLLLTALCVIAAAFAATLIAIRARLVAASKRFVESLAFHGRNDDGQYDSYNLTSELEKCYQGAFITAVQKNEFKERYKQDFDKACALCSRLEKFRITIPEPLTRFINDCLSIDDAVRRHNGLFVAVALERNKKFFDCCLDYPLDMQQRRTIVTEEDNCLVVSSAGSGKTSSIVGKVKYLTQIKGINPSRILLISYTHKAACELTSRMASVGIKGYTFHKLALDIIARHTGIKPSICDNSDALFVSIYHELLKEKWFKEAIVEYFIDSQMYETEEERSKREKLQLFSESKSMRLKALLPDMDGRAVYVRSEQERKLCFMLSSLGVKFRYEEPYEYNLADEAHAQYHPDFSIYFEKAGKTRRVYLEHFGVDEHGNVPAWFAHDKGMTYEEANQKYNDGITWKKEIHEKFGTKLIATSCADFHYGDVKNRLKSQLAEAGVPICEKNEDEMYDLVLSSGSNQEKSFIRLIATFAALLKSSCKTIENVIMQAEKAHDDNSAFFIKHIFKPAFDRYKWELHNKNQIDFTDAIIQATKVCQTSSPVDFDYIIVDEFQDISVDRYIFLKALRASGAYPAKLYCVGDDWQSIYRFSGSDVSLFNRFPEYFGETEIDKIETTYRFGNPLVSVSSGFIQRNGAQIKKKVRPFSADRKTDLELISYAKSNYISKIAQVVSAIPANNSIFLLGRYTFDDYYLSRSFQMVKEGGKCSYVINGRKIEFLTVHKSKGLEADYVILLQCNKGVYGFPTAISDNPALNYVLTQGDKFPHAEERRLFYVATTRAKLKTFVFYDERYPSVFVNELLHPESTDYAHGSKPKNANKNWTRREEAYMLKLYAEGVSVTKIAEKMGRSRTSIVMRLQKFKA